MLAVTIDGKGLHRKAVQLLEVPLGTKCHSVKGLNHGCMVLGEELEGLRDGGDLVRGVRREVTPLASIASAREVEAYGDTMQQAEGFFNSASNGHTFTCREA